ncbi:MBL fold metallo-hydrolase [Sulfoacidibacillus thermotolerans]|uniref:MBL fold metallo-hydrolase n=1 Tax=Sulfoacidibacillus thermotolerans TaxID=1765684 RepID=UPI001FE47F4A|nr:MBL fold metallo-hydrolase [Sulfoacidibacillus thermotolerans]
MSFITVEELNRRIQSPGGVFILDVRSASDYLEWHIEDYGVESVNIAGSILQKGIPEGQLPKNREIVVVCAKGKSAQEVTHFLKGKGYAVVYLQGGMEAWSEFYRKVQVTSSAALEMLQVIRPAKGCLSYFLYSQGEALVVDPARHIEEYLELAKAKGVQIRHILDTHLHADHISGGHALSVRTGGKYWIAASEMQGGEIPFEALTDGLVLKFGESSLEVLAIPTPGHTPGSTSFLVNGKFLLSGDTVFVSGLGRPDLGGKAREWAKMLYETVIQRINKLSDDVIVLPAHYSDFREVSKAGYIGATLGELRATNELVRGGEESVFTEAVAGQTGAATPPNYETIVKINRGEVSVGDEEATELEIGPNRCAVKHLA